MPAPRQPANVLPGVPERTGPGLAHTSAKSELALLVRQSYAGESQEDLAEGMDCDRAHVAKCGYAHEPNSLSFAQVARGLRHPKSAEWCRRYLARFMASVGTHQGTGLDDLPLLARLASELPDVVREFSDGLATGGVLDRTKIERVTREAIEARDLLDGLLADLRRRLEAAA